MYLYGGMSRPVALGILVLFSMYLGLYHGLFALLFTAVRRGPRGTEQALLLTPFIWVALEFARGRITGFPWDLLGYSQVDNLWLTRLAPICGVMSISFVIAAVNAAFACLLVANRRLRVLVPGAALVAAILLQAGATLGTGLPPSAAAQSAVLLQENLAVGEAAREVEPIAPSDELKTFSQLSLDPHVSHAAMEPATVIVWPEAPSHFFSIDPIFRSSIGALARLSRAPAIVGTLGLERSGVPATYREYDSAALFDASGVYAGRYDKVHLVPWGEYIPFKQFFSFAHKLTEGAGDMQPGKQRSVFVADGHTYGTFICYESIFGDEVRPFVEQGAQVLVNISNDGWYGDTGAPWQHLNMTRMRAIENNRWLLLDTNNGVTTSIDPYGRMVAQAPRHVRAAYQFPFAFVSGTTAYTRYGDWFACLCAIVSLIAVGRTWGSQMLRRIA